MAKPKLPPVDVVDFETKPILPAPQYPPKPVGVSIQLLGERKPKYYAWGHPTENNCTFEDGRRALMQVYERGHGILCHHAKFDLNVAATHMDLPVPSWERIHDTVFLAFLNDPYSKNLKLKELAQDLLGMEPEERDAIRDWAIAQKLMPKSRKEAGEFIHLAPGKMVGTYANGDIIRTRKLFELLWPIVVGARGMGASYDRERRLLPVLMANEKDGVPTDLALLRSDAKKYGSAADAEKFGTPEMFSGGAMDQCDELLRKQLKTPGLNVDSDTDLAAALIKSKKAREENFFTTPGGKISTAKDSILNAVSDQKVLGLLQYRSKLSTAKNTFLLPWLRESELAGGRVRPSWNQVRQHGAGGDAGAKTGRLSASRFMNVPKPFLEKAGKFAHPAWSGLPVLPEVRKYLLPERGHLWGKRDYMQQEIRMLGHFEDGPLLSAYADDPYMDAHDVATAMMKEEHGIDTNRDQMKTIGFALIYGMGLGALAERLGVDTLTAKRLKAAYLSLFPGLKDLIADLTGIGKAGMSMRTWGGREYFVEPAGFSEKFGRMMSYEYKLINFLIQGSSADCTKEAIIRYDQARRDGIFKVTVHDELNISAPKSAIKREMLLLREVMASVEVDVLMLSDGSIGPNWGALEKLKEPKLTTRPLVAA
jgi:DNA polymerase I-like protein with 3'-5' exonuclease and polymerase domains